MRRELQAVEGGSSFFSVAAKSETNLFVELDMEGHDGETLY